MSGMCPPQALPPTTLTLWLHADAEFLKRRAEDDADAGVRELCVGCLGQLQLKLREERGE